MNHLAADHDGMAVLAAEFGYDRPLSSRVGIGENLAQTKKCRGPRRRAIDQRHDGSIAAAVQHVLQSHLQRAELPVFWRRINRDESTSRVNQRSKVGSIFTGHDDDEVAVVIKDVDGGGQESFAGWTA